MKHSVYGRKLNRDKNQRTALFRSLVRSLILQESIQTTQAKAKAIKGLVDKLVTKSKDQSTSSQQLVRSFLISSELVGKLVNEITPRFSDRSSGFTSTVRVGSRLGDGAMMVKMSWVESGKVVKSNKSEAAEVDVLVQTTEKQPKRSPSKKKEAK